jgi:hypothetical protein
MDGAPVAAHDEERMARRDLRGLAQAVLAVSLGLGLLLLLTLNWYPACGDRFATPGNVVELFAAAGLAFVGFVASTLARAVPEAVLGFLLMIGAVAVFALMALSGLGDAC